tara:strand:+ start:209 stop:1060 length:852 start_codon:yes stop_codon:yes gene_type:complete
MKIFICTNKFQKLAAKVSAFSFAQYGFNDIEILEIENHEILKDKLNSTYLRDGKITKFIDDLQSFTLLRFYPFTLKNLNKCLIIDPDVFAVKDPTKELNEFFSRNEFKIACTKINENFRTEVILLNNISYKWDFEEIINDLFNHKIDYKDLIYLNSKKYFSEVNRLPIEFNHHDKVDENTLLLHTTKRITQPWKEGLKIDFYDEKNNKIYKFKQQIKKLLNLDYNINAISKNYIKHPNKKVDYTVLKIFKDCLNSNFIKENEIEDAIRNKYVSKYFYEKIVRN